MLADRLKQLRISKKKKHEDVAKVLGITRQAYGHYENGKRQPDNNSLQKLSEYFAVSIDFLLTGKDQHGTWNEIRRVDFDLKKKVFFKDLEKAPEEKIAELIRFWEFIKERD